MILRAFKQYLPKGLYGRAALILVVPIVTLQLVVSAVFIQRLYEEVTVQMTRNVLLELQYLLNAVPEDGTPELAESVLQDIARPLSFKIRLPADPIRADQSRFYDLSGRVVIRTLRGSLPGISGVDLTSHVGEARFTSATVHGPLEIVFSRNRVSARNPHQLLVLMIFTGALMTVIAYLFLRNQLKPIKRLANASEAFGRGQIVPYHPSGASEVRAAGRSFLSMRARIERQIEQRTLMLSGVSHDLRTPLTRMRLALSMDDHNEDSRALLNDIGEMEALLDGFLNFARGDAMEDLESCDPVQLLQQAADKAARGGADVEITHVDEGAAPVMLRPTAVARALDNLIGNALRYGKRCRLRLRVTQNHLRFVIEDDGPGIPPDQRVEALKPFARLEPARNQNKGAGVGLGLSIALDTARGHGGDLRLSDSETLGGLRAELVLPR